MAEEPREEQQEKAYEAKDNQQVDTEGNLKEEAAQEQAEEPKQETQEEQPEMPPPNIYAELQFMAWALSQVAWQLMGLQLPQGHKEPVKDMTQAKLAIDTVAFIADKLHPHLDEEERKMMRGMVSDLQLNFVRQNQ